jgi:hypothetical protein
MGRRLNWLNNTAQLQGQPEGLEPDPYHSDASFSLCALDDCESRELIITNLIQGNVWTLYQYIEIIVNIVIIWNLILWNRTKLLVQI